MVEIILELPVEGLGESCLVLVEVVGEVEGPEHLGMD